MDTVAKAQQGNPLEGLYGFAKAHLLVINAVVLASSTLVGLLDFLAPRLSLVPTIIYSVTACLVALMLLSAIAPAVVARLISTVGFAETRRGGSPLWRRPQWQIAVAILLGMTILGFMSVAKAKQGGLIASNAPAVRRVQEAMLGLREDVGSIKAGVESANGKLDSLVSKSEDPRRDLVSKGYSINESGLMAAIKQGDRQAIALFIKIGLRIDGAGPLSVLLFGHQPWDGALAAMIPKSMILNPAVACRPGFIFSREDKPPVEERIAAFKRLCDPTPVVEELAARIQREDGLAIHNDAERKILAIRVRNLALLRE